MHTTSALLLLYRDHAVQNWTLHVQRVHSPYSGGQGVGLIGQGGRGRGSGDGGTYSRALSARALRLVLSGMSTGQ